MEIIGVIIAGAIIGALAKLVMPGKQAGGIIITILLGIVGVIIGYYLAAALGVEATKGIDWIRWIISIIVAVVLIAIYGAVTGRRNTTV
ncbi:GlsB/YeaQ/YmgE family stress response membrane protein [Pedococcus bigeumensis]|uniref:GlsB/YeaQ/YmgE family stress response membrane protein n=1 Tax=Pedococcus bigeumensis TaxID=433644 RepID=UPI002FE8481D